MVRSGAEGLPAVKAVQVGAFPGTALAAMKAFLWGLLLG